MQGALNRVNSAFQDTESLQQGGPGPALVVSIEGGVEWLGQELHCFAWAVAKSCKTGAVSKARSASFMLPDKLAELVKQGMELGDADDQVFARTRSGQGSGTVGILSNGLITRTGYYEHTVMLALIPFMKPELYPEHEMGP